MGVEEEERKKSLRFECDRRQLKLREGEGGHFARLAVASHLTHPHNVPTPNHNHKAKCQVQNKNKGKGYEPGLALVLVYNTQPQITCEITPAGTSSTFEYFGCIFKATSDCVT